MTGEARVTGPSCSTSMNRICCSSAIGRRRHCMPSLINSSSPCLGLLSSMRCDSGIREAMRAATPHFTFTRLSRPQRCRRPCERASYRDRRPPPGRLIVPRPHALRWHFRWCTDCFACETKALLRILRRLTLAPPTLSWKAALERPLAYIWEQMLSLSDFIAIHMLCNHISCRYCA